MNIVVYPYSAEQSYIKAYRELFNYNIVRFMCCNGILPVNFENCANEMVLVTKWVDKHTIPYTINNLSVLTP